MSETDANRIFGYAIDEIAKIAASNNLDGDPGEKLVRIVCAIRSLPAPLRDRIASEVVKRMPGDWFSEKVKPPHKPGGGK